MKTKQAINLIKKSESFILMTDKGMSMHGDEGEILSSLSAGINTLNNDKRINSELLKDLVNFALKSDDEILESLKEKLDELGKMITEKKEEPSK